MLLEFPPKATDLSLTPILPIPLSLQSDFLQGRKIIQTIWGWIYYLAPESSQPHGFTPAKTMRSLQESTISSLNYSLLVGSMLDVLPGQKGGMLNL